MRLSRDLLRLDLRRPPPKKSAAAPEEWAPIAGRPGWYESTRHRNADGSRPKMYSPPHEQLYPPLSPKKAAP